MLGITIGYRLQTAPGTLGAPQSVVVDLSTATEAGHQPRHRRHRDADGR